MYFVFIESQIFELFIKGNVKYQVKNVKKKYEVETIKNMKVIFK